VTSDDAENEQAFSEAVRAKQYTDAVRTLLGMTVYVPMFGEKASMLVCGRGGRGLVRVYTSNAAATAAAERIRPDEPPFSAMERSFAHLLRNWSSAELGVVVNPDTESELQLPVDRFGEILGLRWRDIPVGEEDAGPYFRGLSPRLAERIAQVHWYPHVGREQLAIRYFFVARFRAEIAKLRLPRDEYAYAARRLADDVQEELGPKPANLQPDVELHAARFVGVRVVATVEAQEGADTGWLQSRTVRALYDFLHPQTGGPDGNGWPIGRTLNVDQIHHVLADLDGVRDVREIHLARVDPGTEQMSDDVDEVVLDQDCSIWSHDHDVTVEPAAATTIRSGGRPDLPAHKSHKTTQAVGIGIAVTPVLLATILQLLDAASAPLWIIMTLIALTGVATILAATRAAKADHAAMPSNAPAPGQLSIADIKITYIEYGVVSLDFRVSNAGGSTVSIHAVELESVAVDVDLVAAEFQEVSATYDVDITPLQSVGAFVTCDVAQQIAPGDVDRFVLHLHGRFSASFSRFAIRPILMTNCGPVSGDLIELYGRP
jgi:hypothetical protein